MWNTGISIFQMPPPSDSNAQTSLKATALKPASLSINKFMKQSDTLVFTEPRASVIGPD